MNKREYRGRLKDCGYTVDDFVDESGMGETTWRNWGEVPVWAEYWLYWKESEARVLVCERRHDKLVEALRCLIS